MRVLVATLSIVLGVFISNLAAQDMPTALPEHEILKKEVGVWEVTTSVWMNEQGQTDDTVEPMVSKAVETNRMLGDFWVVSDYKGDFAGMEFTGLATLGYDPTKKCFVGNWRDSISPTEMTMTGKWDAEKKILTWKTKGVAPDGSDVNGIAIAKYIDADNREMTTYEMVDGKKVKSMHFVYKRSE